MNSNPSAPDLPPPGWFPDPWDSAQSRYWDGAEWTAHTHLHGDSVPEEPLSEAITEGAKKAWAHTITASRKARAASGPALAAAGEKSKELWGKASESLAQRRAAKQAPFTTSPPPASDSASTPSPTASVGQLPPPQVLPLSGSAPSMSAAPLRRPLTQHLAVLSWLVAGLLYSLNPFITTAILYSQYQAFKSGSSIDSEWFAAGEQIASDLGGQAFGWIAGVFIVFGIISLIIYIAVVSGVSSGSTAARVWGTIFAILAIPGLVSNTLFNQRLASMLAWAELDALTFTNAVFPLILLLNLAGVLFVWLPPTNEYARRRQYAKLSRRYPTY